MTATDERQSPVWGVFGGSFNPPHIGHVLACHFALSVWALDKVLVIPSYQHPFGKSLESFEHRVAMCQLAFAHVRSFVEVSRAEETRGGLSYTVDTLRALRNANPAVQLRLIIGSDILQEAQKWRAFDEVKELAPLLVIPRLQDGQPLGSKVMSRCYLPDVSSSDLRENLAAGTDVGSALPAAVREYIEEHGLYRRPADAV
ncbi:MAG: nicotinate (nicotinamide) nucleotide adenylyltransferase [Candidatus Sumerlaeaceae bacterium]